MENKLIKQVISFLSLYILILLTIQLGLINGYSLEVVWEENFDDGNFDGWTLSCIHQDDPRWWYADTETGVEVNNEGQLVFTSKGSPWHDWIDDIPGWQYNYTRLWRSTTVANGSWSWDMYPGHQPCGAAFITKTIIHPTSPISHTSFRYGYRVSIIPFSHNPEDYGSVTGLPFISIEKYTSTWSGTVLGLYESTAIQNNSWYHINVTRDYNSLKLYLDGVLRIEVTDSDPHENFNWGLPTDEFFFQLNSHGGTRVDNITVIGDEIVHPTTTTTTTITTTDGEPSTTTTTDQGNSGFGIVAIILSTAVLYYRKRKK